MLLPVPSVMGRAKNWFLQQLSSPPPTQKGFFYKAQDFNIDNANFIEADTYITKVTQVISGNPVFELLEPYSCLEATQDSSARHPPPRCHHGTRSKIRDSLMDWLRGGDLAWKMLWVRGFAGTGKSAVAQSFAESCDDEKRLGGSYFFSRATGRNKLKTVVPTLVSQLAVFVPEYRHLIELLLAKNPFLLQKSPPIQFRKLIVEPFTSLQRQKPREPIAIILDGLDECEGEDAQLEILELIANAVRTNPDLPLRWLICSRPEPHLKDAFLKLTICGREELIIDAECRDDVAKYTREGITRIKGKFRRFTPLDWPPEEQLEELLDIVSGLFVFASSCLNYIGDPKAADPKSQLENLLTYMRRSQGVMSRNPLTTLDLLYSQILEDIPSSAYNATSQILAYMSFKNAIDDLGRLGSVQVLCNFLRLDEHTFYKAVHGLYSVMAIPEPEDAARVQLRFHHASFLDFLLNPIRSGKFAIHGQKALNDFMECFIYWYEIDATHFHTQDGWHLHLHHKHDSLPGLPWASEDSRRLISESITTFLDCGSLLCRANMQYVVDEGFLSISDVDFRYWDAEVVFRFSRFYRPDSSITSSVVRTAPSEPMDQQLLDYFNLLNKNGISNPVYFPHGKGFRSGKWIREYFIIGHGIKSAIVWRTQTPTSRWSCHILSGDKEPSEAQILEYEDYLEGIEWDEEKAALQMQYREQMALCQI